MSKKQTFTPIINKEGDFLSPNRRTYREFMAKGLKTERLNKVPYKRDEPKVMNGRTKQERKDLAKKHGSTGTNLKKKHIHRERLETGYYDKLKGNNNE